MNYHEYQRQRAVAKAEKRINMILDNQATAFAKKELTSIDNVLNRGRGGGLNTSKVMAKKPSRNKGSGNIYRDIREQGQVAAKSNLRTERVTSKDVIRDRETLQDYITKTGNVWLVDMIRRHSRGK